MLLLCSGGKGTYVFHSVPGAVLGQRQTLGWVEGLLLVHSERPVFVDCTWVWNQRSGSVR